MEIKYFAIYNNRSHKQFLTFELALESNPWLIVKKTFKDKIKSYFDDSYFEHFFWIIFDSSGNQLNSFNQNNWSCLHWEDRNIRNYNIKWDISDPNGEVKSFYKALGFPYFIFEMFDQLQFCSKFPNWSIFEIAEENIKLKEINIKLIEEQNKLKNEIDLLKKNQK